MTIHTSIFRTLRADHELARRLLTALAGTEGDTATRRELHALVRDELLQHAVAEEETLYAAMRANKGTKASAMHSVHEHREIEELLKQLAHIGYDQPEWISVLQRLQERVEHHLDEEESETFMSARNIISEQKSQSLAIEFLLKRNQMKLQEHAATFQRAIEGVTQGTLEAKSKTELERQASKLNISEVREKSKSELITQIREKQGTARAFTHPSA